MRRASAKGVEMMKASIRNVVTQFAAREW